MGHARAKPVRRSGRYRHDDGRAYHGAERALARKANGATLVADGEFEEMEVEAAGANLVYNGEKKTGWQPLFRGRNGGRVARRTG